MNIGPATDFLVYLLVRVLICIVQAMPVDGCRVWAGWLATLFCDVLGVRREVVEENLVRAYPELSPGERRRLAWRMWEHLFLLVAEVAHAPRKIHDTNWRDYIRLSDSAALVRVLLNERPTVIVSAHFGNFELSGYVLGILGFPTFTIARPLDNGYLDRFLNRFRGTTGQHILPKHDVAHRIDGLLARGAALTLLGDQHAGAKGCWVEFFGRPASTHKAIALFALSNDAPLAVCYSRRVGGPLCHVLGVEAVADPRLGEQATESVSALTQWYTSHLEQAIRRAPEQYWWLHRRWKDTRRAKVRRKKAA